MGKYVFDLGGGFKDEAGAKLTLFAGAEHIDMANPGSAVTSGTVLGGYGVSAWTNNNYSTDRNEWVAWTGASYATGPWTFTGAYYHYDQAAFITGGTGGTGTGCTIGAGNNPASNCAGTENEGSFSVDYRFNKHFDVYTGVNYATVAGGLAHNFQNATFSSTDQTSVYTGLRLKF